MGVASLSQTEEILPSPVSRDCSLKYSQATSRCQDENRSASVRARSEEREAQKIVTRKSGKWQEGWGNRKRTCLLGGSVQAAPLLSKLLDDLSVGHRLVQGLAFRAWFPEFSVKGYEPLLGWNDMPHVQGHS